MAAVNMLGLATQAGAADTRDALLEKATAHLRLSDGGHGARHPLTAVGAIQLSVAAEGDVLSVS